MDQVCVVGRESVFPGEMAGNLLHPWTVGLGSDSKEGRCACRQIRDKPHDAANQLALDRQFNREEITRSQDIRPVSEQREDNGSLYSRFKQLIHLRNSSAALTGGSICSVHIGSDRVVAFVRVADGQSLLVVDSLSAGPQAVRRPEEARGYDKQIYPSSGQIRIEGENVVLEPYETVILGD